jgi:hypothetical protein
LESVIEKKEKKELFAYSHQLPIGSLLVLPWGIFIKIISFLSNCWSLTLCREILYLKLHFIKGALGWLKYV